MGFENPEVVDKRPFRYHVIEAKPLSFTSKEDRVRIHFRLSTKFLKGSGLFWVTDDM